MAAPRSISPIKKRYSISIIPGRHHRDRGKRLRLPSYLQIESASRIKSSSYPKQLTYIREALPILDSGHSG